MNADALICSHPRSGGRWLRFLLAHYLSARHSLGIVVTPETVFNVVPDHEPGASRGYGAFRFEQRRGLPLVGVCHQPFDWSLHRGYPTIFLLRNAYDVMVSAYFHLAQQKGRFSGSMADFIAHPMYGLQGWVDYINAWSPHFLVHRDAMALSYGELDRDPHTALGRVLSFLDQAPTSDLVEAAVLRGAAFRSSRKIRTGQEGNFWDHLQPEDIFRIQERLHEELSDVSIALLKSTRVEIDPFPRTDHSASA